MIAMGFQNVVTGQWWPSVFPGIALAVTVFGFALVGASIEALADPVRRRALLARAASRALAGLTDQRRMRICWPISAGGCCSSCRSSSASSWSASSW